MGIGKRLLRWFKGKPKEFEGRPVFVKRTGARTAESYRGYKRNAIYGRQATGNTPLDLRRAIRGLAGVMARERLIPTVEQLHDLALQVELSR